eukprot:c27406_g1_i1 orf=219-608(+)
MFTTWWRHMPRKSTDATLPTRKIVNLLRKHGPVNANDCWKVAEPAGIKSKRHMKSVLRWLMDKNRVRIICHRLQEKGHLGCKEFLYGLPAPKTKAQDTDDTDAAVPQESLASLNIVQLLRSVYQKNKSI